MQMRILGRTGLRVSRVSFGSMTFGSQVEEPLAVRMIARCLDAGVNFFDTADMYNQGRAEEILGRALGKRRPDVILASKVRLKMGEDPNQQGLSRRWILAEIEASLRRLGTDYLDLYYMHSPDYDTALSESLGAMDLLVRQGKIRYSALSNFASWQFGHALAVSERAGMRPPVASQVMYNLIARAIEAEHLAFCREMGVGLVVYNPLAGGLLCGKHDHRRDPPEGTRFHKNEMYQKRYWHEPMFEAVRRLGEIARLAGRSMVQLSLQWLAGRPQVDSIILGASSMQQLEENLGAWEGTLDEATTAACDEAYARLAGPIPRYNR
jgi:aryl-alcohol dehydrogenase-like predicted oxidoreductase